MNAEISVFVLCVEAIIYLLLYNLHDCTFKNFAKLTGKHLYLSLFFKDASGLQSIALLKQRLRYSCFPVNFAKFLRMPFFIEHLRWLFLYKNHGFAKPFLRSALELLLPGKHYKVELFENIGLLDLPKFCHSGNCCIYSKEVYSNKL